MQYNVLADISYLNLRKESRRFQISLFVWKIHLCKKIAFGSSIDCCWWWSTFESKQDFVKLTNLMRNSNVCNNLNHWGQHWLLTWFYWDPYGFVGFWFCFFLIYIVVHFLQSYNSVGMPTIFIFFNLTVNIFLLLLWRCSCKQEPLKVHRPRGKHKRTQTKTWGLFYFFKDVIDIFKTCIFNIFLKQIFHKPDKQFRDFLSQTVNTGKLQNGNTNGIAPLILEHTVF